MIKFYKYHGAGNDFFLIEDYKRDFSKNHKHRIPELCHRRYGIGADGLILLQPSQIADVKMRFFNPDGTEASMCGNGLRCSVLHWGKKNSAIETQAGICIGEIRDDLIRASLPQMEDILSPIALDFNLTGYAVNTGTEHLVIPIDDWEEHDFLKLAKHFREHPMFSPNGINVNMAKVTNDKVEVRTYEKGVEGETFACGTGCGAVAMVLHKHFSHKNRFAFQYPHGDQLNICVESNKLWMEGPAELVFWGKILLKKLDTSYNPSELELSEA